MGMLLIEFSSQGKTSTPPCTFTFIYVRRWMLTKLPVVITSQRQVIVLYSLHSHSSACQPFHNKAREKTIIPFNLKMFNINLYLVLLILSSTSFSYQNNKSYALSQKISKNSRKWLKMDTFRDEVYSFCQIKIKLKMLHVYVIKI